MSRRQEAHEGSSGLKAGQGPKGEEVGSGHVGQPGPGRSCE